MAKPACAKGGIEMMVDKFRPETDLGAHIEKKSRSKAGTAKAKKLQLRTKIETRIPKRGEKEKLEGQVKKLRVIKQMHGGEITTQSFAEGGNLLAAVTRMGLDYDGRGGRHAVAQKRAAGREFAFAGHRPGFRKIRGQQQRAGSAADVQRIRGGRANLSGDHSQRVAQQRPVGDGNRKGRLLAKEIWRDETTAVEGHLRQGVPTAECLEKGVAGLGEQSPPARHSRNRQPGVSEWEP